MEHFIITFSTGERKKLPVHGHTEEKIREHCAGLDLEIWKIERVFLTDYEQKDRKISYEVRLSFNEDVKNVTIAQDELPAVMWSFLNDEKVVCRNGVFRGKDIISILPNFNAMMGWNKGYEFEPEDFAYINANPLCLEARNYQNQVKELCYTATSCENLIGMTKQLLLR